MGVFLSGEIFKFVVFVSTYPEVIIYLVGLAIVGALGQMFIFYMVSILNKKLCMYVMRSSVRKSRSKRVFCIHVGKNKSFDPPSSSKKTSNVTVIPWCYYITDGVWVFEVGSLCDQHYLIHLSIS